MGERPGNERSAIIFGARNLGRAVIETLVADGRAVAGVARSQATLDVGREEGARAREADVTDPASCTLPSRRQPRRTAASTSRLRRLGIRWRSQRAVRRRP